MPTPKRGPRLGGGPAHQKHMMSNLASDLFRHGRIKTTEAKAKTLRPYAEKLITKAKAGDLPARRQVLSKLRDRDVVAYLFEDVAPRFADRNGGYTRILKLGPRAGDNAPMAIIELVEQGERAGEDVDPRGQGVALARPVRASQEAHRRRGRSRRADARRGRGRRHLRGHVGRHLRRHLRRGLEAQAPAGPADAPTAPVEEDVDSKPSVPRTSPTPGRAPARTSTTADPRARGVIRLRIDLAYDGGPFAGFARQRDQVTVQGTLEGALSRVTGQDVDTTCAGRTDRGVHALAQVVHVDLDETTDRAGRFLEDLERTRDRLQRIVGTAITIWRLRVVERGLRRALLGRRAPLPLPPHRPARRRPALPGGPVGRTPAVGRRSDARRRPGARGRARLRLALPARVGQAHRASASTRPPCGARPTRSTSPCAGGRSATSWCAPASAAWWRWVVAGGSGLARRGAPGPRPGRGGPRRAAGGADAGGRPLRRTVRRRASVSGLLSGVR